jgi:hypothetical protein
MKSILKKSVLVVVLVVFGLTFTSCQKDSDKQDELKKPNKVEYDGNDKNGLTQEKPTDPSQPSETPEQLLINKMNEINKIIGDDYTIYVTNDSKHEVVTFLYNKKEGFFQSISSDKLLYMERVFRNFPEKLVIYNTNKLQKHYIDKKPINILNKNEKFYNKIVEAFLKIDTKKEIVKE